MDYHIISHAWKTMYERGVSEEDVRDVVNNPEQIVPEKHGRTCYQSRKDYFGEVFLLRVIVDESSDPAAVVTVYLTTNLAKYWRP
jgi:hypothetical protein